MSFKDRTEISDKLNREEVLKWLEYDPKDETVSKFELDQQFRKMQQFVQHPDWAHEYDFVEKSISGKDKKV